jgi:hypothetical protein
MSKKTTTDVDDKLQRLLVYQRALAAFSRIAGEALPPERLEPAYLRDHVALTLAEQQARRDAR